MPASHGHDQHHGPAGERHRAGFWARLREMVVPHSHADGDTLDTALETSRAGMRCLKLSFAVLVATAVVQTALVFVTGSVALLGDTLHNYADALTAVPLAIAFLLGRRAASRRYTYGFGRAEDLAGLVVVILIAASAVFAATEAIDRLIDPEPVRHLPVLAAAGAVGFAGNEVVARYRIVVGRRIGSAALVADGLHARTDGFTSLAVVLGAIGVALGAPVADPVVGLLISVAILYVLRDAAREVYRRLMDSVDPRLVGEVETVIRAVPGVLGVSDVRLRWIGHALRAEASVAVDPTWTVAAAHRLAHEVEHALVHRVRRLTGALIHTEPASAEAATAHAVVAAHR